MIETKELEIVTEPTLTIDMQQIVTVGIARGERNLRNSIKAQKEACTALDSEIKRLETKLQNAVGMAIPEKVRSVETQLCDVLKQLDFADPESCVIVNAKIMPEKRLVSVTMQLKQNSEYSSNIALYSMQVPYTDEMTGIADELEEKTKARGESAAGIVVLRKQLSDIGSIERQIRARVVEAEMNKSATGRSILDAALKSFEDDMKLLGV